MALNQETLQGNWNQIRGKLRERWGQLSDDDLKTAQGNIDQLVGLIQRKTGEGKEAVMKFLEESSQTGSSFLGQASETVQSYAEDAMESIQDTSQQAMDALWTGYEQTEQLVRERPGQSLAVCFGTGILAGLIAGILFRPGSR